MGGRPARRRAGRPAVALATLLAALAGLLASAVAPAAAQRRNADLTATGTVTVTWRGDPARGCAAGAPCDVTGTAVLPIDARGQLVQPTGRRDRLFGFLFDEQTAVVRVRRRGVDPAGPTCVDAPATSGFGGASLGFRPVAGGRVTVALQTPAGLTSSRCAGPLAADLRAVLPRTTVASAGLLRTGRTVSLAGSRPFAAGPFSGEVVSTVALRIGAVRARPEGRGRPVRRARPTRRVLRTDSLRLTYTVASAGGAVTAPFAGSDGPSCELLDSCGLTGATTLTAADAPGRRTVSFFARVRRPAGAPRPTAAALLRRVRAGTLRIDGGFGLVAAGRVRSSAVRAGIAAGCADEAPAGELFLQPSPREPARGAPRRVLELALVASARGDGVARTRCPGPGLPGQDPLATVRLPVTALGARTLALPFAAAPVPSGPGYALGPPASTVRLVLRRRGTAVTTSVRRLR